MTRPMGTPLRVGAVLLAAGAGSRLGHRPKCLLELDGVPLIRRLLSALAGAGVGPVVVVLGHHAASIEAALQTFAVNVVHNPRPDDGQVSSQRIGLTALSEGLTEPLCGSLDAILVALADQPLLNAQDIFALVAAFGQRPASTQVVHPRVQGQRGNPVIFSTAVRDQILAGAADFGSRQWQQLHPEAVAPFDTDNRHYKIDIDTPEDIERFERDTPHRLRWPAAPPV